MFPPGGIFGAKPFSSMAQRPRWLPPPNHVLERGRAARATPLRPPGCSSGCLALAGALVAALCAWGLSPFQCSAYAGAGGAGFECSFTGDDGPSGGEAPGQWQRPRPPTPSERIFSLPP